MTLYTVAKDLLFQLEKLAQTLGPNRFAEPIASLGGATIGQHMRHVIEFYQCLQSSEETVNYDRRERNLSIEKDPQVALREIQAIASALTGVHDCPLRIEVDYSLNAPAPLLLDSSFQRELAYNIEHTVHHMALMKVGIRAHFHDVVLPDNFGIAISTLRHQRQLQTQ